MFHGTLPSGAYLLAKIFFEIKCFTKKFKIGLIARITDSDAGNRLCTLQYSFALAKKSGDRFRLFLLSCLIHLFSYVPVH